jgi:probable regulatory domain-containing protein
MNLQEIPLRPLTRQEIHKLETALLFYTMLRKDVFEKIRDPSERVTWVDSLAVAAGAWARYKAGFTARQIAEELGRTEATIREHLEGKTKAGALVKETYELLARGQTPELVIDSPEALAEVLGKSVELAAGKSEEYKQKLDQARSLVSELKQKLEELEKLLQA